ncbi:hypothetical protein ACF0H5_008290 [Mactra antiquata]
MMKKIFLSATLKVSVEQSRVVRTLLCFTMVVIEMNAKRHINVMLNSFISLIFKVVSELCKLCRVLNVSMVHIVTMDLFSLLLWLRTDVSYTQYLRNICQLFMLLQIRNKQKIVKYFKNVQCFDVLLYQPRYKCHILKWLSLLKSRNKHGDACIITFKLLNLASIIILNVFFSCKLSCDILSKHSPLKLL